MARDPRIALDDMTVAIDRIAEETDTLTFEQFAENWRARYVVERALLIVSEASRAIPESFKEKHADIRWIGVRDIGNVIRHPICVAVAIAHLERHSRRTAAIARRRRRHPQGPRSAGRPWRPATVALRRDWLKNPYPDWTGSGASVL